MSTLLREIIRIPETAGAEDYALRLTEGVGSGRLARTIDENGVTHALAGVRPGPGPGRLGVA